MAVERKPFAVLLTPSIRTQLLDYSEHAGVSATGLVEAWIRGLVERIEERGMDEADPDLVAAARKIDAGRRRRGR